jgi:hypothetical protein
MVLGTQRTDFSKKLPKGRSIEQKETKEAKNTLG